MTTSVDNFDGLILYWYLSSVKTFSEYWHSWWLSNILRIHWRQIDIWVPWFFWHWYCITVSFKAPRFLDFYRCDTYQGLLFSYFRTVDLVISKTFCIHFILFYPIFWSIQIVCIYLSWLIEARYIHIFLLLWISLRIDRFLEFWNVLVVSLWIFILRRTSLPFSRLSTIFLCILAWDANCLHSSRT